MRLLVRSQTLYTLFKKASPRIHRVVLPMDAIPKHMYWTQRERRKHSVAIKRQIYEIKMKKKKRSGDEMKTCRGEERAGQGNDEERPIQEIDLENRTRYEHTWN